MSVAPKSKRVKQKPGTEVLRYAPPDAKIPARLGGGLLKELVEQDTATAKLMHYAFGLH